MKTYYPARAVWQNAPKKALAAQKSGSEALGEAGREAPSVDAALQALDRRMTSVGKKIRDIEAKPPESRTPAESKYLQIFKDELKGLEKRRLNYLASDQRGSTLLEVRQIIKSRPERLLKWQDDWPAKPEPKPGPENKPARKSGIVPEDEWR